MQREDWTWAPTSEHCSETGFIEEARVSTQPRFSSTDGYAYHITDCVQRQCIGCYERVPAKKLITCPCSHKYCRSCLRAMADIAVNQEEYFPVRCCAEEIPTEKILCSMRRQDRKVYKSRAREYAVPPSERWYCPRSTCGQWIPPEQIDARSASQVCRSCRETICSNCRGPAHESWNCVHDPELRLVLDVAQRNGWQRCYHCHAIVERVSGCAHMLCRCQAKFWYLTLTTPFFLSLFVSRFLNADETQLLMWRSV